MENSSDDEGEYIINGIEFSKTNNENKYEPEDDSVSQQSDNDIVYSESEVDVERIVNPVVIRRPSSPSPWNVCRRILMRYRVETCVLLAVLFSILSTFFQASGMIKAKLQV